jgi:hypothetical protein
VRNERLGEWCCVGCGEEGAGDWIWAPVMKVWSGHGLCSRDGNARLHWSCIEIVATAMRVAEKRPNDSIETQRRKECSSVLPCRRSGERHC